MPIYEYRCESCGHELEALQKMSDAPLVTCPQCGEPTLHKVLSAAAFRLKGGGWYETDFKRDNRRNVHVSAQSEKSNKPTQKQPRNQPRNRPVMAHPADDQEDPLDRTNSYGPIQLNQPGSGTVRLYRTCPAMTLSGEPMPTNRMDPMRSLSPHQS